MSETISKTDEPSLQSVEKSPQKKTHALRKRVIILILAVITLYGLFRWYQFEKVLDQESKKIFQGHITLYTGKNDKDVYWIYLNCITYTARISVSPQTHIMSEDLKARLEAHEDNLFVNVLSIYTSRDAYKATKNGGRFTYPAYSIELVHP